jgi:hypothetical protein
MLRLSRFVLGLSVLAFGATTAVAQQPVALDMRDGLVTIKADNVPLRAILTEWARVGGTNVVGADRIVGAPVTIEMTNVPEHQVLEVLLRNTSGYMLATRPAGVPGASAYNRILIMPPSTAPRALPVQAVAPSRLALPDDDNQDDGPPNVQRPGTPVRLPTVSGAPTPPPLPVPETPEPVVSPGSAPAVIVTPSNPFGLPVGSSSQPGVIVPVPQQQPQRPNEN